jgi:hypothetical protein
LGGEEWWGECYSLSSPHLFKKDGERNGGESAILYPPLLLGREEWWGEYYPLSSPLLGDRIN